MIISNVLYPFMAVSMSLPFKNNRVQISLMRDGLIDLITSFLLYLHRTSNVGDNVCLSFAIFKLFSINVGNRMFLLNINALRGSQVLTIVCSCNPAVKQLNVFTRLELSRFLQARYVKTTATKIEKKR
jgi:hypothetical protein